jgi:hypothetical protein
MKRKSTEGKLVRVSAAEIPKATEQDLARLRKAAEGRVDTSEISEMVAGGVRARRDAAGRPIAPPPSPIRSAILRELGKQGLTRYELWKRARSYCTTLSESAVYEFLRGERQIGLQYLEALLAAVDLTLQHKTSRRRVARAG